MKLLTWDGSLRKHKPSVPNSISQSNNCVTIKTSSKNTNGQHQSSIQQKSHPASFRQAFLPTPSFLGKEKSVKCTYLVTGRCFIHPLLIFATQSLVISLQHVKLCISLLSKSL